MAHVADQSDTPTADDARRAYERLRALVGEARAAVIITLLEPQTTGMLANELSIAPSTASEHLNGLLPTGLLGRNRRGREVYYALHSRGRTMLSLLESEAL